VLLELADEDRIARAYDIEPLLVHHAWAAHGQAGAGKRMALQDIVPDAERSSSANILNTRVPRKNPFRKKSFLVCCSQ
jgi:hypothetical protein